MDTCLLTYVRHQIDQAFSGCGGRIGCLTSPADLWQSLVAKWETSLRSRDDCCSGGSIQCCDIGSEPPARVPGNGIKQPSVYKAVVD